MSGAIPPLSQYASIAWYSVKAQEQFYIKYMPVCDIKMHDTSWWLPQDISN